MSRLPFLACVVVVLCILASGCTGTPAQQSPATPKATQNVVTPSPQLTSSSVAPGLALTIYPLVPGPVQTVPLYESVSVSVNRNTITENPTITITYNGGKGLGMTEEMSVYVIRADGSQVSGFVPNPHMGSAVTLMGDTGTDQVIVYITMNSGTTYKVIDQNYPFIQQM